MDLTARKRFDDLLALTDELGPALVRRGVLQHFFVSPLLPMEPLTPRAVGQAWQDLATEVRAGRAPELFSLYLHVPFCVQRCRYCVYYSVALRREAELETYLARLHAELDFYAERLSAVAFNTCYVGGGTPTLLSEAQLERLLSHLDESFQRLRGGAWGFECNPATVTPRKAEIFAEHGFNRVSFGVQSLNPDVLDQVNRGYQTAEQVQSTMEVMHRLRFEINVDLIRGLPTEPADSQRKSLAAVLALGPQLVTVYDLSPYTPDGLRPTDHPPLSEARDLLAPVAEEHGYTIEIMDTALKIQSHGQSADNRLTEEWRRGDVNLAYNDVTTEPVSLLGIGPTARSYLYNRLRYEYERYGVDKPFDPGEACLSGRWLTPHEEQRRFVVGELGQHGRLLRADYAARFGDDFETAFADELAVARELELLDVDAETIAHVATEAEGRFATELLFVDPSNLAAARLHLEGMQRAARSGAAEHRPAPGRELPVVLQTRAGALTVMLVEHEPGRPSFHHTGRFAFYLPSEDPEGTCNLADQHAALLARFRRRFDQVVRDADPADLEGLRAALLT